MNWFVEWNGRLGHYVTSTTATTTASHISITSIITSATTTTTNYNTTADAIIPTHIVAYDRIVIYAAQSISYRFYVLAVGDGIRARAGTIWFYVQNRITMVNR